MAKQGKSKSITKGAARPSPYKKAKVDVTFDSAKPRAEDKGKGKGQADGKVKKGANKATKPAVANEKGKQVQGNKDKVRVASPKPKPAPKAVPAKADKGKGKSVAPSSSGPSTFVIIAGSYEKILYGIEGSYLPGSSVPTLEPIFIFPAHLACVKAVAASPRGKWLATGSEDEFVKVWDLRRRKEVGSLSQHTGSITSLTFPTPSHLLTSSEDSTLSLFRTSDWSLLKSLKGHSGRVNHVDVHPTGRVALSVGKDKTLKMWDLMRGRGAASLPLGSEAELVKFSQEGTHFAVLFPKKIEIYSLTLKLLHVAKTNSRFNSLLFTLLPSPLEGGKDIEILCVGTEKGVVEVFRLYIAEEPEDDDSEEEDEEEDEEMAEEGKLGKGADLIRIGTLVGHTNRIKSISSLPFSAPTASGEKRETVLLTTASSDGLINVYDLSQTLVNEDRSTENVVEAVASYNTKGTRLTCVYLADGQDEQVMKIKEEVASGGENESDEEEEEDEGADFYGSEQGSEEEDEDEEEEEDEMEVEFEDEDEEEYE